jgi:hypothetical protein
LEYHCAFIATTGLCRYGRIAFGRDIATGVTIDFLEKITYYSDLNGTGVTLI